MGNLGFLLVSRGGMTQHLGEGVEWRRRRFFAAFVLRLVMAAKTERSEPTEHPDPF